MMDLTSRGGCNNQDGDKKGECNTRLSLWSKDDVRRCHLVFEEKAVNCGTNKDREGIEEGDARESQPKLLRGSECVVAVELGSSRSCARGRMSAHKFLDFGDRGGSCYDRQKDSCVITEGT